MTPRRDPFGFQFWLGWILKFVGWLAAASIFWTWALTKIFGQIRHKEIIFTWAVAVFGSWFLMLTPFMRKKEQIWKRLNQDEEKAVDAWLLGSGVFVGLLIAPCIFWSLTIVPGTGGTDAGDRFLSSEFETCPPLDQPVPPVPGTEFPRWLKSVFTTWLVLTLPFLILMYRKADRIFKEAVSRQTQVGTKFRSVFVEKSKRILPEGIAQKIKAAPETLARGHIVSLTLNDQRVIRDVFVLDGREILGVYGQENFDFSAVEVVDAQPYGPDTFMRYEEEKWLRMDGRS